MVHILDGNSEHVTRVCKKLGLFGRKKTDMRLLLVIRNALNR